MSFLKIKDPIKRDLIVAEFLKTKKNIQEKFITECLGDISAQREISKLFKPITETQKDIKERLVSELRPIKESLKELPAAITFPQLQAIAVPPEDRRGRRGDASGKDRSQISQRLRFQTKRRQDFWNIQESAGQTVLHRQ